MQCTVPEHEVALVVLEGTRPAGHTKHASTLPGEYSPLRHPLQELRAGVTAKVPAPHLCQGIAA